MTRSDTSWQKEEVSKSYLEGVRGAIPLAEEQLDIVLKMIETVNPHFENFLDLGCGDGILGRVILSKYPAVQGVFLDFSPTMLEAAKSKVKGKNIEFICQDYGVKEWVNAVEKYGLFDVIVSGFSIHHQPNARKQEIYAEIYRLLKPGGLFLNLEHVASNSEWLGKVFDEYFIDSLYAFHHQNQGEKSRAEIGQEYYYRPDKAANILAPVEMQCDWLRELGYINVDCYFKIFEIALFGGMRSPN
jgi:tRNA (cmo5U34)-methyltransferase